MTPSRLLPSVAVAAVLTLAGCDRPGPAVPKVDLANSAAYAAPEFKDDAPANAAVGEVGMPLSFVDSEGNPIDLTQYRGKKKVVLVVLRGMPRSERGAFCPSCLAQTGSILANQEEFARRRAEVLVVFPGPSERVSEFLERVKGQTPGEPGRRFRILLDRECAACDRLGIRDDLAKPSTYILDTNGHLVYAYVGVTSTDRPSVKAILAQLDKAP